MTQCDAIALYLQSGHELTPLEALNMFRCFRLAARIAELRERGMVIDSRIVRNGRKGAYAAYKLHRPEQSDLFPVVNVIDRAGHVSQRRGAM